MFLAKHKNNELVSIGYQRSENITGWNTRLVPWFHEEMLVGFTKRGEAEPKNTPELSGLDSSEVLDEVIKNIMSEFENWSRKDWTALTFKLEADVDNLRDIGNQLKVKQLLKLE